MTRQRWAASPLLVDESLSPAHRRRLVDGADRGDGLLGVLVELNLKSGLPPAVLRDRFRELLERTIGDDLGARPSCRINAGYERCLLRRDEIISLLVADHEASTGGVAHRRLIFRIWPDYVMHPRIDVSCRTIKADAADRTYASTGAGIVWAVLDTGIDATHPHFAGGTLTDPAVTELHADFTWLVRREPEPGPGPGQSGRAAALRDEDGHGTHVAGIIAGRTPERGQAYVAALRPAAGGGEQSGWPKWECRDLAPGRRLSGMAPLAFLVSLKVLDSSAGAPRTTSSAVMRALQHVREMNSGGHALQIHGVNLSLGCPWLAEDYAAGQSPLCRELNLLVNTGVVAVVSAGNSGSANGQAEDDQGSRDLHGVLSSITEPGHAAGVITVGSTHRDSPHTFGVSYTSAKGPTLDGRLKPDLVAPGEKITSAASGLIRSRVPIFGDPAPGGDADGVPAAHGVPGPVGMPAADGVPDPVSVPGPVSVPSAASGAGEPAYYAEESGTSMAAPHVSGAVAAFLSVRTEFIGQPEEIKRLFCDSAISLGRDRFFEGHGLVDLMGALAKV
jgi:subtilisin family serine protease